MELRKPPTGVVILRWYFTILGIISVVLGVFVPPIAMLVARAVMVQSGAEIAVLASIIALIGVFWAMFAIGYGIFQILIGVSLIKGRGWARIAALVVGIISIHNMPVGTALGILCLVFLLDEEGRAYFQT
jgi:hypothetical protein